MFRESIAAMRIIARLTGIALLLIAIALAAGNAYSISAIFGIVGIILLATDIGSTTAAPIIRMSLDSEPIHSKVRGIENGKYEKTAVKCVPGERLLLIREPTNKFDGNAVKVCRRSGKQIGYLSKELAARLAVLLDQNANALVARVSKVTGGTKGKPSIGVNIVLNFDRG